jgi:hypothetical protein
LRVAHTVRHVGDILQQMDWTDDRAKLAEACYLEALEIYRGDPETVPLDLGNALRGYALLAGKTGRKEAARGLWAEAGAIYAQVGIQAGVDECARRVAELALEEAG